MDGYSLKFCVIKGFELVTKGSLAIDAYTCFNNRKIRLRLASLSAGSSDGITKFKSVFNWRIALRRHRPNTPSDSFSLIDFTMTETFPC